MEIFKTQNSTMNHLKAFFNTFQMKFNTNSLYQLLTKKLAESILILFY